MHIENNEYYIFVSHVLMLCVSSTRLLFELSFEHSENLVNGFFLEVGLFDKHFAWSVYHSFCSVESDSFDSINYPLVDFVGEFVEVDIFVGFVFAHYAEHVDGILCQHAGELDVHTATSDG